MRWQSQVLYTVLAWVSISACSPITFNDGATIVDRDLKSCNDNLALSVLKALKATKFCTDFLTITTKTFTNTATTTVTVPATTTVYTTTNLGYTVTTSTIASVASTAVETVTGPSSTITITSTAGLTSTTTTGVVTTTTQTQTVTIYQRNMVKRDLEADSGHNIAPRWPAKLERRVVIPSQIKSFASSAISTACNCYVTAPSTTKTVTATATSTSFATLTNTVTTSTPAATQTVTLLNTYTVTSTTSIPGATNTNTLITSVVVTTTTVQSTSTVTSSVTTTATPAGVYTLQFSGTNCVQNKYNHYDLVQEAYSTPERLFQVCAARCATYGAGCKSFFAYQDNDYPYQWCIIDDAPYDPAYRQCAIPFSGVNRAYNSPY